MAICNLTKNLLKTNTCAYSLPQVTDIYVINYEDISGKTGVDYDCESGVTISGLGLTQSAAVYHIEPQKGSTTFSDELVVGTNGNKYRTHTVTFTLAGKYDKDMVCPQDALSLGRFFVVVKNADGEYLGLGGEVGLEATVQSVAGGGDTNGVTVTLAADTTTSAIPLAEAVVTDMLGRIPS